MSPRIHRINLSQFRNYKALRLEPMDARWVVLTGENGAGKTNILEAVSFLVPGRGLRGADLLEVRNREAGASDVWAVAADFETELGTVKIGTGLDRDLKRRALRINGKETRVQKDLAEIISAVWLTPQMDGLFLDSAAARRKFMDRLIYALIPAHVTHVNRYEKNMRERLALLRADRQMERLSDPRWLLELEQQMSADAVAIAAARTQFAARLQEAAALLKELAPAFPHGLVDLDGMCEQAILKHPAVDVEDQLRHILQENRAQDCLAGRTHAGAHRCDFIVSYGAKGMPAAQSSTGEQKALLVSIILAHALMTRAEKGSAPLVLLDEVAAHLDASRRQQLFDILSASESQIWVTGTDAKYFTALKTSAAFYTVENNQALQQKAGFEKAS